MIFLLLRLLFFFFFGGGGGEGRVGGGGLNVVAVRSGNIMSSFLTVKGKISVKRFTIFKVFC